MFSLGQIKAMQDEHTKRAKRLKLKPYVAINDNDKGVLRCQFLGYYIPVGWDVTDNLYFVDSSGFGANDEIALTVNQFLKKVKKRYGYGIREAGQFQVYIQEYKRKE